MQIDALIEPHGKGYRASSVTLPGFVAEGATKKEAAQRLQEMMQARLKNAEIVKLQIALPSEPNPLLAVAGSMKDHPDFAEWVQDMAENRRQIDADPNRP